MLTESPYGPILHRHSTSLNGFLTKNLLPPLQPPVIPQPFFTNITLSLSKPKRPIKKKNKACHSSAERIATPNFAFFSPPNHPKIVTFFLIGARGRAPCFYFILFCFIFTLYLLQMGKTLFYHCTQALQSS
jgi:hypothetical protein